MESFDSVGDLSDGNRLAQLIGQIQDSKSAVMFVSPHLDDAVLSCGALLTHLARTCPVTVLTVFSSAAPPARSALAARKTMRGLGIADAQTFFGERREEDIAVLQEAGASWIHLGLVDALFRQTGHSAETGQGTGRAAYPTFRFDAARGRIAASDSDLAAELSVIIKREMGASEAAAVFGPLGVGRHVDHLITRTAVATLGVGAIFYSDFPYSVNCEPDSPFIEDASLQPYEWLSGRAESVKLMEGYRTQFAALFPKGVPIGPETYWIGPQTSAI